tara:strand:+ start:7764 stop:8363 length:600 start_codon:yes stop_codon:yes gene_type:complete
MHSFIIATLMATTAATAPTPDKPVEYFELARQAIFNCPNKKPAQIKPTQVFDLIALERKHKVPKKLRGIMLTMDCLQELSLTKDGFQKLIHWKGDNSEKKPALKLLDNKSKKTIKHSRFNKGNFKKAADITLRRITTQIPAGKNQSLDGPWLKAWIKNLQTSTKNTKPSAQKHLMLLKKWHEKIKKDKKKKNVVAGCTC